MPASTLSLSSPLSRASACNVHATLTVPFSCGRLFYRSSDVPLDLRVEVTLMRINPAMRDIPTRFSNWAVKRCLEATTGPEERRNFVAWMRGRIVDLATNCYGYYVLQKGPILAGSRSS
ncbi:hypothetical protein B0H11DRAFT_2259339 [Mycena galericulata]|nr:hypothetical protein B0H11DRAFT_2259339 [Mycena galericulata]